MIRKFATVPGFRVTLALVLTTILAGATTVHAQQAPAQPPATQAPSTQPPANLPSAGQQSGTQEATPEEINALHKVKVKGYKNWVFNVGAGANATNGNTKNFVRSGGGALAAGVARNYSQYFGFRLDFQWTTCLCATRRCFWHRRREPPAMSTRYRSIPSSIFPRPRLGEGMFLAVLPISIERANSTLRQLFRARPVIHSSAGGEPAAA